MSKYKAKKVTVDGITFDSKKEAQRYINLKAMERQGLISNLQLQVPYELIPSQRLNGKVVERACKYIADFSYEIGNQRIVEDVKGYRKGGAYAVFTIKRKLMLYLYGIQVKEI